MPSFGPYNIKNGNKETFINNPMIADEVILGRDIGSGKKSQPLSGRNIVISPYLDKYMQMWVWDWDDTLLDTRAYYRHSMNGDYIRYHMTKEELELDMPNYQYFVDLVYYLVEKGVRVGIASFGTYSIIRAYMDRIFGMNQKLFSSVNIYASCQEIGENRDYNKMPINKNSYIQKMMNHYKLNDYSNVVLFDDNSTNIADALRLGVFAIQIDVPTSSDEKERVIMSNVLFGSMTMMDLESRLRDGCKRSGIPTQFDFGYLGDRKVWKRKAQQDAEMMGKVLTPNFMNEGFTPDVPLNATPPDAFQELFKDKPTVVEGFYNQEVGVYPSSCNSNLNLNLNDENYKNDKNNKYGLIIEEGFSQCMDCQNPMNTYFIGLIFLALVGLLALFVYFG
jgi:FMN phosphatase YigB (HAD superfamily)